MEQKTFLLIKKLDFFIQWATTLLINCMLLFQLSLAPLANLINCDLLNKSTIPVIFFARDLNARPWQEQASHLTQIGRDDVTRFNVSWETFHRLILLKFASCAVIFNLDIICLQLETSGPPTRHCYWVKPPKPMAVVSPNSCRLLCAARIRNRVIKSPKWMWMSSFQFFYVKKIHSFINVYKYLLQMN